MGVKKLFRSHNIFLMVVFAILAAMSWFDVTTSGQAGLVGANRGLAHVFIALAVMIHGIYFLLKNKVNKYCSFITILLYIILFWFLFDDYLNGCSFSANASNILMAIWWILTFSFTYSFCRRNPDSVNVLLGYFVAMFLLWVFLNLYARIQISTNFEREKAITGFAYYLIVFLPMIYLLKDSLFKKILIGLSCFMVMTSFKRGAMVTLPIMVFVYYFFKSKINGNPSKIVKYVLVFLIVGYTVVPIVDEQSGGFISERFKKEELMSGSGRDVIRNAAFQKIDSRNSFELLVGTGHGGSEKLVGTGLHNEWLEFYYNFGIVGLVLYFFLGIALLLVGRKAYLQKNPYTPHIFMMIAFYYLSGLFSGFYGVYPTYYFFAALGIISYLSEKHFSLKNIKK